MRFGSEKCGCSGSAVKRMNGPGKKHHISSWILGGCGVWLIGLGFYFMILRPPLLPEDLRYMDATLSQVGNAAPGMESWLKKVFTVMGGFMAGAGVLTMFVATVAMPARMKGASWTIALSGALTVGLMNATNFVLHSDFRWTLLVPAVAWLVGIGFYRANR